MLSTEKEKLRRQDFDNAASFVQGQMKRLNKTYWSKIIVSRQDKRDNIIFQAGGRDQEDKYLRINESKNIKEMRENGSSSK